MKGSRQDNGESGTVPRTHTTFLSSPSKRGPKQDKKPKH